VTVEGTDFVETPSLKLGDTWLLSVTQVSSTTLDAVVPAGMAGGTYDLALYNGGDCQEATLAAAFTIIEDCISPTVTFESDSPVTLGQGMHFSATLSGTPPFSYTWDFGGLGDCLGCDTLAPVYTYTAPGWYTVELAVDNPCDTAVASQQVQVTPLMHPVYLPLIIKGGTP
jgi:PKD repeat protein